MEALGRVELPTNGLGNRCSIHLSYRAACGNGITLQFTSALTGFRFCAPVLPECGKMSGHCSVHVWQHEVSCLIQVFLWDRGLQNGCTSLLVMLNFATPAV